MAVIQTFSRQGIKLIEFNQECTYEWVENEPGTLSFSISVADLMARLDGAAPEPFLRFGNLVLVQHPKLPDFVGIITQRQWGKGIIAITARGAMWALKKSVSPFSDKTIGTNGALFKKILSAHNTQCDWKIQSGDIFLGGVSKEEVIEPTNMLKEAQRAAKRANARFDITAEIDERNRLTLFGNWREIAIGAPVMRLVEGENLEDPGDMALNETIEETANHVNGLTNAGSSVSRTTASVVDAESEAMYGPMYYAESYTNVTQTDAVQKNAQAKLAQIKDPAALPKMTALDVEETFYQLKIGAVVECQLIRHGFDANGYIGFNGLCRIVAMRYMEKTNKILLTLEAVK